MAKIDTQASFADRLRSLHRPGEPLLLPNAWDAASARAVERAGFAAVATTSSGISASLGFEDREGMPVEEAFGAIARISRSLSVPLTADLESGYGLAPEELVERLLKAGAVGCNLEDSDHRRPGQMVDALAQAERIRAVKAAARAQGVDLVLNARVDVFVPGVSAGTEPVAEGMRRARLYREAGADCIFPILLRDEAVISAFVQDLGCPVNILSVEGTPSVRRLRELRVARISFGSSLQRVTLTAFSERIADILKGGAG